jgi:S1-C subfamily serine protease
MTEHQNILRQFSDALAERVERAKQLVVAIRLAHKRHISGIAWRPHIVVTTEQSLPRRDEFEVVAAGGAVVTAKAIGRDSATNIALLQIPAATSSPSVGRNETPVGSVAIAIGADGMGGASARMGIVNIAGPEWHSSLGGQIDRRIVLDLSLARREEGGPVFDAADGCIGMSTFGPRRQVLAIPTATIERIVPLLLKHGHVPRGWLGVALHAVAVPDALVATANQSSGLMVMSIVKDGPAARAGILTGDIILSVDGTPTHQVRKIAGHFGSESIGRNADLRLVRGGTLMNVSTPISERPAL